MNYCEESSVIDVIVLFCQEEQLGKVGTRVPISIWVCLEVLVAMANGLELSGRERTGSARKFCFRIPVDLWDRQKGLKSAWKYESILSFCWCDNYYISLFLPTHKSDAFFQLGNQPDNLLLFRKSIWAFHLYLISWDLNFQAHSELWLHSDGTIPTCSWFMTQLHAFFSKSIGGQSMCAGSATALVEAGIAPALIQAAGRWSLDTFIWRNAFFFEALIGWPSLLQTNLFHATSDS